MTSGITTCAEHHIAQAAANLDDGDQIFWQLVAYNVVTASSLELKKHLLSLEGHRGFDFGLDRDVVAKAAGNHRQYTGRARWANLPVRKDPHARDIFG